MTRSITETTPMKSPDIWTPRIFAVFINLIFFMLIWYLSDKLFSRKPREQQKKFKKSKYSQKYVQTEYGKLKTALNTKSKETFEIILNDIDEFIPRCNLALKFHNFFLLWKFSFFSMDLEKSDSDIFMDFIIAKCFVELGKIYSLKNNEKLANYCGFQGLKYGINCIQSKEGQNLVINAVLLTKSKLVLKSVLFKIKNSQSCHKNLHPLLDSNVGLSFFRHNLKRNCE